MLSDNRVSGGILDECDTVACRHCRAILRVRKGTAEGYWCGPCHGPICAACAAQRDATGRCEPFFQQIEQRLARERSLRSMELRG